MANNYTQFSEQIENLTLIEVAWCKDTLRAIENASDDGEQALTFLGFPAWCDNGVDIEIIDDQFPALWIYSEEGGNIEAAVEFIQAFFTQFRPDDYLTIEWAETCSKPRLGEFGGGAVVITRANVSWLFTSEWVANQVQELKQERGNNDRS